MAAIDLYESDAVGARRPVILAGLRRLWTSYRRLRAERRALIQLSQLDSRLLRDIGLEPYDVYDAINGRRQPSALFHPLRRRPDHQ